MSAEDILEPCPHAISSHCQQFMKLEPACVKGEKLELDMKNDVTQYIHLAGSVRTVCQVVQLQRRGEREKLDPRLH